ncbi:hypothetical protein [Amycolatopsis plumensis]|uniref:Uncharacterized protein n=1 Tax=Amycolatopsis plumensis TaxID=236508 RepID=A0ABV5U4E9_9PSEU
MTDSSRRTAAPTYLDSPDLLLVIDDADIGADAETVIGQLLRRDPADAALIARGDAMLSAADAGTATKWLATSMTWLYGRSAPPPPPQPQRERRAVPRADRPHRCPRKLMVTDSDRCMSARANEKAGQAMSQLDVRMRMARDAAGGQSVVHGGQDSLQQDLPLAARGR